MGGVAIFTILTLLQRWDDRMHMKGKIFDIYFEIAEGHPLGELIRAVRDMDLEISDIRMETDTVLSEGYSAFIATVTCKKRRDHTGIIKELRKLQGVNYLEEI